MFWTRLFSKAGLGRVLGGFGEDLGWILKVADYIFWEDFWLIFRVADHVVDSYFAYVG